MKRYLSKITLLSLCISLCSLSSASIEVVGKIIASTGKGSIIRSGFPKRIPLRVNLQLMAGDRPSLVAGAGAKMLCFATNKPVALVNGKSIDCDSSTVTRGAKKISLSDIFTGSRSRSQVHMTKNGKEWIPKGASPRQCLFNILASRPIWWSSAIVFDQKTQNKIDATSAMKTIQSSSLNEQEQAIAFADLYSAKGWFKLAFDRLDSVPTASRSAAVEIQIGDLMLALDDFGAEDHYRAALSLAKIDGDVATKAVAIHSLAIVLIDQDEKEEGPKLLKMAADMYSSLGYRDLSNSLKGRVSRSSHGHGGKRNRAVGGAGHP
jgi:hypothetical protein